MTPEEEAHRLIADLAAATGFPEAELHEWLASPPVNPGWNREDTFFARLNSLRAGPMPPHVIRELRRMFHAGDRKAPAA
ncbi:hypothetical protein ACOQFV_08765 [Nocardiopsis changdeensis]|uniref:Uncharacterized protein n=1 Tax=Nocardiopsis changdeensis TaxID=2831969 RepID=A0ABX8BF32_9ACTN|nr:MULTISPECIES: hypothetical protein [Nocardiopsis]QUX20365.1 hypothetical protein KGD84_17715 [Nocardiopsis changdeensis]QYX36295.1 hypothetical protein K1J57_27170 [Nocardiopsis sp. MT53]